MPAIYFRVDPKIKHVVRATTNYTLYIFEIHTSDRSEVKPQPMLYIVMKIWRTRVRDGRYGSPTGNFSKLMKEVREYQESLVDTNLTFLKTIKTS